MIEFASLVLTWTFRPLLIYAVASRLNYWKSIDSSKCNTRCSCTLGDLRLLRDHCRVCAAGVRKAQLQLGS